MNLVARDVRSLQHEIVLDQVFISPRAQKLKSASRLLIWCVIQNSCVNVQVRKHILKIYMENSNRPSSRREGTRPVPTYAVSIAYFTCVHYTFSVSRLQHTNVLWTYHPTPSILLP